MTFVLSLQNPNPLRLQRVLDIRHFDIRHLKFKLFLLIFFMIFSIKRIILNVRQKMNFQKMISFSFQVTLLGPWADSTRLIGEQEASSKEHLE